MNTSVKILFDGLVSPVDVHTKYILSGLAALLVLLIFWWFYRIIRLVKNFLGICVEVLGGLPMKKFRMPPFYLTEELKGSYKGREVSVGILYSGFNGEFLPVPCIRMRLREVVGYNVQRLPNYAAIEKNDLVYKVKLSVLWGVFDKNYPQVFSKSYLIIAMERLLSTAEDVERGRTIKEVFK